VKARSGNQDVQARLAMLPRDGLPLQHVVQVHWDEHQIPFVEAASDQDLALTLGVIHVHLRWTQMELMRHIARGRMAELLGPFGTRLDRSLRTLDLTRAAPHIADLLPVATRNWAEAFVSGINYAIGHLQRMPAEFRMLGLAREEWSLLDIISVGRLAAFDVTWLAWLNLLRRWHGAELDAIWCRLVGSPSALDIATTDRSSSRNLLQVFLQGFGRFGSNSWAVAPGRSASGSACIASDTHLPALLPNLWLIAGYRSPSYHSVGLMAAGIPAILLGRNPWIVWGGTNLHAASSDLFDVSHLPANRITQRRERIRVRFGGSRKMVVRDTEYGPMVSDLRRSFRKAAYALRWMGHSPSDELTAMLAVNRARNWQEFRAALDELAVPGQNMIYADVAGHIGKAMAVHLPMRNPDGEAPLLLPASSASAWDRIVRGGDLPASLDPPEGFVASANDRPPKTKVRIGYLFSSDHRIKRLREALQQSNGWNFATLAALQQDVLLTAALPIRDVLVGSLRRGHANAAPQRVAEQLAVWDGRYTADSTGALAFELLLFHLGLALQGRRTLAGYAAVWNTRELLFRDIEAAPPHVLARILRRVAPRVLASVRQFRCWGSMHRLQPRHILASLPVIGRRFRTTEFPADGGSDTVLKTAHAMTGCRHRAGLVSTARHISDLSDLDDNWFVLLGGQDGWSGSTTTADQVPLWRTGKYIRVPLRPESVRQNFPFCTELRP
jgi:penicillin amidase